MLQIIRFCLMILFIIGFFPIIPELIAVRAALMPDIFSWWSVAAVLYLVLMTEIDIYIIAYPPSLRDMVFLRKILPFDLSRIKPLLERIKMLIKKDLIWQEKTSQHEKIIKSLGYLGLIICATLPGLGRLGNGIYARTKRRLAYGRYFLYFGCLIRFLSIFGILNIL